MSDEQPPAPNQDEPDALPAPQEPNGNAVGLSVSQNNKAIVQNGPNGEMVVAGQHQTATAVIYQNFFLSSAEVADLQKIAHMTGDEDQDIVHEVIGLFKGEIKRRRNREDEERRLKAEQVQAEIDCKKRQIALEEIREQNAHEFRMQQHKDTHSLALLRDKRAWVVLVVGSIISVVFGLIGMKQQAIAAFVIACGGAALTALLKKPEGKDTKKPKSLPLDP